MEKETKCLIIVVVDVDLKDCEKGEKPKDENEEAKTKATMRPTRYTWANSKLALFRFALDLIVLIFLCHFFSRSQPLHVSFLNLD